MVLSPRALLRFFTCFLLSAISPLSHADPKPNIILVLCDDLRADALACMGHPWVKTPNIDALSNHGVTFDNAFATTSICVTSRCNVLTGQYAATSGWRHGGFQRNSLSDEQLKQTYLHQLKSVGYRLAYSGKWHVGEIPKAFFDDNFAYEGQGEYVERHSSEHLTTRITNDAIKVIEKPDSRPFFMCIGFKSPHVQDGKQPPFYVYDPNLTGELYKEVEVSNPPSSDAQHFINLPDFLKRSLNRERWGWRLKTPELLSASVLGYHRLVSGVDHAIGEIRKSLEANKLHQNTVIIFTSDHGVYLGARGFAGKWLPHEPSIRIPLIIYDPRLDMEKRVRQEPIALTIDLAPTILNLARARIPGTIDGESLIPLIEGRAESWRTEFFYDHFYMAHKIPASEAVRTERWKYIRYVNSDPLFEELYDLREDPDETKNLVGHVDYAFVHQMMEKKWQDWRKKLHGN